MSCDLLSKDWERGVKVNTPVKSSKSPDLISFHKLNSQKQRGCLFWFLKDKTCYIKNDKYRMENGYSWVHVTFQCSTQLWRWETLLKTPNLSLLHPPRPMWKVCTYTLRIASRPNSQRLLESTLTLKPERHFLIKDVILIFWTQENFSCSVMEQFLIGVTATAEA